MENVSSFYHFHIKIYLYKLEKGEKRKSGVQIFGGIIKLSHKSTSRKSCLVKTFSTDNLQDKRIYMESKNFQNQKTDQNMTIFFLKSTTSHTLLNN